MGKMINIKRRVRKKTKDGVIFEDVVEKAELLDSGIKTCLVRLSNGDIIKRKNKDVLL